MINFTTASDIQCIQILLALERKVVMSNVIHKRVGGSMRLNVHSWSLVVITFILLDMIQ